MSISPSLPRITLGNAHTRPELDFVLPGLLAKSVGLIVGQGGVGKSFLALHIGLAMTTGKAVAGGLWDAPKVGPTTLIMGEDDVSILQERLYWLRQEEQLTDAEVESADQNLFIYSARGYDIRIIEKTRDGFVPRPFFTTLKHYCVNQRLVIIDPLVFLNGGDENDNAAAAVFMSYLYSITRETGCTIILLHHVGKSNGDREEWAAARGASAITTAIRWQINLSPPSAKEMECYGIDDEMRKSWVRVACVKSNYATVSENGWLHRVNGGVLAWKEMIKSFKPTTSKKEGGSNGWQVNTKR